MVVIWEPQRPSRGAGRATCLAAFPAGHAGAHGGEVRPTCLLPALAPAHERLAQQPRAAGRAGVRVAVWGAGGRPQACGEWAKGGVGSG